MFTKKVLSVCGSLLFVIKWLRNVKNRLNLNVVMHARGKTDSFFICEKKKFNICLKEFQLLSCNCDTERTFISVSWWSKIECQLNQFSCLVCR